MARTSTGRNQRKVTAPAPTKPTAKPDARKKKPAKAGSTAAGGSSSSVGGGVLVCDEARHRLASLGLKADATGYNSSMKPLSIPAADQPRRRMLCALMS